MAASLGDIFKFRTTRAEGHSSRDKFHIAVDLNCGVMLFINSNPYEGAMRIDRNDWPEMPKEESYISCNAVVRYSKSNLQGIDIQPAGRLTDDCLRKLEDHISKSISMPINDINTVLLAFREYFQS